MNYLERLEALITECELQIDLASRQFETHEEWYWRGRLFSTQEALNWFHELVG